jgi:hypothetical protein
MHRSRWLAILSVLMWIHGHAAAQTSAPDAVAVQILRLRHDHRWTDVLARTHPLAVSRFKRQIVAMMSLSVGMDRSSAYASQAQHNILSYMFRVSSLEELKATPAESLLVRFLIYTESSDTTLKPRIVGTVVDGDSVAYVVVSRQRPHFIHNEPLPRELADLEMLEDDSDVDIMTMKRDALGRWVTMLDGGIVFSLGGFGISLHPEDEPPPR